MTRNGFRVLAPGDGRHAPCLNMTELVSLSLLNGVLFGMLLFMMASGLTLIFSMMGVLNFAHASFYMLGAYFGYRDKPPARLLDRPRRRAADRRRHRRARRALRLRRVHRLGSLSELLFTFGLAFVIEELVEHVLGQAAGRLSPAARTRFRRVPHVRRQLSRLSHVHARDRGMAMFVFSLRPSDAPRVGLVIRASLTHPDMAAMLGHDVPRVFMAVFGVGSALAGLAGVIAGPALVTQPSMAALLGPILFVVVIVGGLGSLAGAFIASLLVGIIQTFAVADQRFARRAHSERRRRRASAISGRLRWPSSRRFFPMS